MRNRIRLQRTVKQLTQLVVPCMIYSQYVVLWRWTFHEEVKVISIS